MNGFMYIFRELAVSSFTQLAEAATRFGPKVLLAAAVMGGGWLSAVIIKKITAKLLRMLGFDVFAEKFGITSFLQRGGIARKPSSITGLILFWVILLNSFIMASDLMRIGFTVELIQTVFIYIPRLGAFIIILALGVALGRFADRLIYKASLLAKIPFSFLAGKSAGYMVIALALLLALDYMGVPRSLSLQLSIIIISVIPVLIITALFTGGRELIANIAAAKYISREFETGDDISSEHFSGRISSMDLFAVKLKDPGGETVIPNTRFIGALIRRETPRTDRAD